MTLGTNEEGEILGRPRICRAEELVSATEDSVRYSWAARLDGPSLKDLDHDDLHIVVPFLRNGRDADAPASCRCYLWFKHSGARQRSCVVIDISDQRIRRMVRPTIAQYDRLVLMLVEQLPIRFLDPSAEE